MGHSFWNKFSSRTGESADHLIAATYGGACYLRLCTECTESTKPHTFRPLPCTIPCTALAAIRHVVAGVHRPAGPLHGSPSEQRGGAGPERASYIGLLALVDGTEARYKGFISPSVKTEKTVHPHTRISPPPCGRIARGRGPGLLGTRCPPFLRRNGKGEPTSTGRPSESRGVAKRNPWIKTTPGTRNPVSRATRGVASGFLFARGGWLIDSREVRKTRRQRLPPAARFLRASGVSRHPGAFAPSCPPPTLRGTE